MHQPTGDFLGRGNAIRALLTGSSLASLGALCLMASGGIASAQKDRTDWTSKLEPRTRAMQVCSLAGLNAFARDKKLRPKADRVVINAGGEPKIETAQVSGSNAAVRSGPKWYKFSFTCKLNETGTKSTGFSYDLGAEIPKAQWEKLGLWQ